MTRRLLLVLPLLVLALAGCGSTDVSRPSGVAERWLQAVSDSGRPGVGADAAERVERYGAVEAARPLVDATFEEDEALFTDLEVGAAEESGDTARVPLRVTRRLEDGTDELFLTAVLRREGGDHGWTVHELDESRAGELVPSQGGDLPASATTRHWVTSVAVGVLLAVVSALVIESQPVVRTRARPGYVPAAPGGTD